MSTGRPEYSDEESKDSLEEKAKEVFVSKKINEAPAANKNATKNKFSCKGVSVQLAPNFGAAKKTCRAHQRKAEGPTRSGACKILCIWKEIKFIDAKGSVKQKAIDSAIDSGFDKITPVEREAIKKGIKACRIDHYQDSAEDAPGCKKYRELFKCVIKVFKEQCFKEEAEVEGTTLPPWNQPKHGGGLRLILGRR